MAVRTNGVKPDEVVCLAQALTNEAPAVRIEATKALRQLGLQRMLDTNLSSQSELELRAAAKFALPGLISALKDSDALVRANAAITLGFLHESPEVTVTALTEALNDEENRVALAATKAPGRFQLDATEAIPALLQAAHSSDTERGEAAVSALKQIDPESAREVGNLQ